MKKAEGGGVGEMKPLLVGQAKRRRFDYRELGCGGTRDRARRQFRVRETAREGGRAAGQQDLSPPPGHWAGA